VPNPLWVDARDLLSSQGHSLNTYNLNNAMDFLASNPQLRPSVVKAGGSGNEAAIGAGLRRSYRSDSVCTSCTATGQP
jgi:hypothetical protein